MKEINIFVRPNDISKVIDIIQRHKIGIAFFDVQGSGRASRSTSEVVHSYQTGRTVTPKFIERTLVISIVPDSIVKVVVEDILNSFDKQEESSGMLFVKDVLDAYELGTKMSGEEILFSK
ncbi:MAG: P-II family nitrogen regulator [Candidatus Nitrosocosmicus sp.]